MIKSLFDGRLVMRVSLPILSLALAALLAVPPGHAQTPPQSESPAEPAPSLRDRLKARFAVKGIHSSSSDGCVSVALIGASSVLEVI